GEHLREHVPGLALAAGKRLLAQLRLQAHAASDRLVRGGDRDGDARRGLAPRGPEGDARAQANDLLLASVRALPDAPRDDDPDGARPPDRRAPLPARAVRPGRFLANRPGALGIRGRALGVLGGAGPGARVLLTRDDPHPRHHLLCNDRDQRSAEYHAHGAAATPRPGARDLDLLRPELRPPLRGAPAKD